MEGELDAWVKKQEEHGWPTDLDSAPRKAAESKEKGAKALAAANDKAKNATTVDVKMIEVVAESTLGKRKQNDLKDEAAVAASPASVEVVEGTPAAKKHAAGDGASSQPTPADTPQPDVEIEVETTTTTTTATPTPLA